MASLPAGDHSFPLFLKSPFPLVFRDYSIPEEMECSFYFLFNFLDFHTHCGTNLTKFWETLITERTPRFCSCSQAYRFPIWESTDAGTGVCKRLLVALQRLLVVVSLAQTCRAEVGFRQLLGSCCACSNIVGIKGGMEAREWRRCNIQGSVETILSNLESFLPTVKEVQHPWQLLKNLALKAFGNVVC